MLLKKTISGVVGLILFTIALIIGGLFLRIIFILLALFCMMELKKAYGTQYRLDDLISAFVLAFMFNVPLELAFAMLFLYAFVSIMITASFKKFNLAYNYANIFAFVYCAIPFLLIYRLYAYSPIKNLYLIIFAIAWGGDTIAYLVGNYVGSRPLAKSISPHKTVEGAFGGIAGAVIITLLVKLIFIPDLGALSAIFLAIIGSVIAQMGDIAASYIKRERRIKDFGDVIPGHGGFLDRFDSVVACSVIVILFIGIV